MMMPAHAVFIKAEGNPMDPRASGINVRVRENRRGRQHQVRTGPDEALRHQGHAGRGRYLLKDTNPATATTDWLLIGDFVLGCEPSRYAAPGYLWERF
jgi:hypothetical protein